MHITRSAARAVLVVAMYVSAAGAAEPPPYVAKVGYTTETFSSTLTKRTVDLAGTQKSGFHWYNWNLFGTRAQLNATEIHADGSATLHGDTTGPNGQLVTAVAGSAAGSFVGTVFGGGAYIEAELKFDPATVLHGDGKGWPSFWSLPMEGNIGPASDKWKDQAAGYRHSLEPDFFEFLPNFVPPGLKAYGGSIHDWYGIPNKTCPRGLCQVGFSYHDSLRIVPNGTDFTQYHRYGFLWVPASAASTGYAQFYFDGEQVGPTQAWQIYRDEPPPPVNQRWAFGILDRYHLFLILGTGVGSPMTVKSVHVWQKNALANLTR